MEPGCGRGRLVNPFGIGVADATEAFQTAVALWQAVATNDLPALRELLVPPVSVEFTEHIADLPARFGVTAEEAVLMAASPKVRVLDDGSLLVLTMRTDGTPRVLGAHGPEEVHGWGLRQRKVRGAWRIVGISDEGDRERIDWIDVPAEDPLA